jgi:succinoglycan biosynthesis protein ExoM
MLSDLISKLQDQATEQLFTYSIVIADNDVKQTAKDAVKTWQGKSRIKIDYYCEPNQNIALARNKAMENAKGNFIAFIDDDEFPVNEWLLTLYRALHSYKVDGVLGPVRPSFTSQTPKWLIKSGLCERPGNQTGKKLTCNDKLRTGNVLFHRKILNKGKNIFEERFGLTGGEDIAFFDKCIEEGYSFVWCEEAPVYEEIPPERSNLSFYLKKGVRVGGLTGEIMKNGKFPFWSSLIKSVCITLAYPLLLIASAFFGKHVLARHLVKFVYHSARVFGAFGLVLIRER